MPLLKCCVCSRLARRTTCLYDGKAFFHEEHLSRPRGADVADNQAPNLVTITFTPRVGNRCCRRSSRAPMAARRARGRSSSQPWAERRHARASRWNTDMFTEFVKIFDPQDPVWPATPARTVCATLRRRFSLSLRSARMTHFTPSSKRADAGRLRSHAGRARHR